MKSKKGAPKVKTKMPGMPTMPGMGKAKVPMVKKKPKKK